MHTPSRPLERPQCGIRSWLVSSAEEQPVSARAKRLGERGHDLGSGVRLAVRQELLDGPVAQPSAPIDSPERDAPGELLDDDPQAGGDRHSEDIRHRPTRSSSAYSQVTETAGIIDDVTAASRARNAHPIAARIRAHASQRRISLRDLSRQAGLSPSTAQKICDRFETDAGDVGLDSLSSLAKAMGVSLVWLLYGDHPPDKIVLRTLPGWESAAREAVERLRADPAVVEAIGGWHLHEAPPRIDAIFVASLARTWTAGG